MSVRFSTIQIHNQGLNSLLDVQSSVNKTQQQIATGKRVLTPGDDPVAATRIFQLTQELELNALYNNNANNLQNRLEREDVALSNINELLQRAQELVIQAGDGAIDAEQRRFVAIEIDGIVESMVTAMNSRDGNGNFVFAGLQAGEQPYTKNADGRYQYRGDEGQRTIQLGPSSFVTANDSGKRLFEDIPSAVNTLSVRANPRNSAIPPSSIGSAVVLDQEQFDAFYPEDVVIEFRPLDEVSPPALTYTIKQVSDGRVLKENIAFQSGELIQFAGAGVRISGAPAAGDTFMVSSTNKKGLLSTLEEFSSQLKTLTDSSEDRALLTENIAVALGNLDTAQTNLLEGQSSVGARLSLVDNIKTTNEDIRLATQSSLAELQDLDFAEAVSQLSQETFILEAAQASFARVSGLSLFNFLR
ncbi:MAG: flagellar hook-associated protein 3 [Pseudomonadales bacterium]|nr:flagellar hook-associated protein 3 [Pseudomonadales bacterium]